MTFDEWYRKQHWDLGLNVEAVAKPAWNAGREEFKRNPPEGLYRIGEEALGNGEPGVVLFSAESGGVICNPGSISRKPAWVPKDGEAVLFEYRGKAYPGVVEDGWVCSLDMRTAMTWAEVASLVKPYKKGCTGRPWDEV